MRLGRAGAVNRRGLVFRGRWLIRTQDSRTIGSRRTMRIKVSSVSAVWLRGITPDEYVLASPNQAVKETFENKASFGHFLTHQTIRPEMKHQ